MQQPTKPDPTTKYYTTGRDDETQKCDDEMRHDATAASNTMGSCIERRARGSKDESQRDNATTNQTACVMRCARGRNATTRQDETRQRDDETTCRDNES
jgi:hypothetical protein